MACLTAEPQPASFGPDVGLQANQAMSSPPPRISWAPATPVLRLCLIFSLAQREAEDKTKRRGWGWKLRGVGLRAVELWWRMNESCRGGIRLRRGWRERQEYLRLCKEGEAGEDKWHKGFILLRPLQLHFWGWPCKCHVGIPATNHSWNFPQSLWQSPAHPNYLSKPLQLLLTQPSYHSQWCWTYCWKEVRKIQ